MSDDPRRSRRRDDDDEFGPPLFGDSSESDRPGLAFDDNTGPLPHWTAPATGELPRVGEGEAPDDTDDLDVWSAFSGQGPVWSDDDPDPSSGYDDVSENVRRGRMGNETPTSENYFDEPDGSGSVSMPIRREPGRITIGTDPTDDGLGRPMPPRSRSRGARDSTSPTARPNRPSGAVRQTPSRQTGGVSGRDMPTAIAVGAVLAAVFIAASIWRPQAVLVIVVVVIGLAAVEFFEKVTEKGYQPASVVGIIACLSSPLAGYFYGDGAIPMVIAFAVIASSVSFIAASGLNSSPMPNMAITTLGITWIGLAGAYGGLILRLETASSFQPVHIGTDTLMLVAIGVVANDIGALFVGSAAGKTPLRGWISPNKSVEGFIGGAVLTFVALVIVEGIMDKSQNWDNPNLIALAIVIAIMAPLGDLTESMFKRNLEIKDFGSIIKGHGGVLDRFDGFLFTLPAVYYLTITLEPWIGAAAN